MRKLLNGMSDLVEMTSNGGREKAIDDRVNKAIRSGMLDVLEVKEGE